MNRTIILNKCALGALLYMLGASVAAQVGQFTPVEIASLPQYCQDKLSGNRNKTKWNSYFGSENWGHFHHFCNGLIYYSRASTQIDRKRRYDAASAGIGEFNYVLSRWPASFSFYQQAQMYKTQLEMMKKLAN